VLEGGSCAIIGMGKLGSQEMTAHSDLDLVCVYDYADAEQSSQGGRRSLLPIPYYTRLMQRLITALTAATKRGVLYEVDMRLRPSGRQGPVASQYKSFIDYYLSQAEFWEHMALTRASMVAGDAQLCQLLRNDIDAILAQQGDQHELVVNIRHMKQLIEDEKSQHELWDLKVAAGGLMDIEFVAQMLVLAFAYQHKELLSASPRAILATALSHHIISQDQYDVLVAGYDMMSALQQITHLALREKFDPAQCASSVLKHISALLHFPDFKSLECAVRDQKSEVRKVFLQVLR
jgi:glutamate-ammonia-ligase adenylyltransferase